MFISYFIIDIAVSLMKSTTPCGKNTDGASVRKNLVSVKYFQWNTVKYSEIFSKYKAL